MLTMGISQFEADYFVSNCEKPSGKTLSVIHRLFDMVMSDTIAINDVTYNQVSNVNILDACLLEDFQGRWGDDAKLRAIEAYGLYFDELCKSYGKQIITLEDKALIDRLVNNFKLTTLSWIFDEKTIPKVVDVYFQFPIYFEIDGIKCKALLDIMIVNHVAETIHIIDLKTTGETVINFAYQASKFRYDIQDAFYTDAVIYWKNTKLCEQRYAITGFSFIVGSTVGQNSVVIFDTNFEFEEMGKFGRPKATTTIDDNVIIHYSQIKGYLQGLDDYKWYLENGFERERLIVENNGVINLGWNRYIDNDDNN
jgi:hypothetical protein